MLAGTPLVAHKADGRLSVFTPPEKCASELYAPLTINSPVTRRDLLMVPILAGFQQLCETLVRGHGYKRQSSGVINPALAYPDTGKEDYFRTSNPFFAYDLLQVLDLKIDLSQYTGFEPGGAIGQISATLALFCDSVHMVEVNPELLALADRYYAGLPDAVRRKVNPIQANLNDEKFRRQTLAELIQRKLLLYDYYWRLGEGENAPDFRLARGSLITEVGNYQWQYYPNARLIGHVAFGRYAAAIWWIGPGRPF